MVKKLVFGMLNEVSLGETQGLAANWSIFVQSRKIKYPYFSLVTCRCVSIPETWAKSVQKQSY